MRLDRILGQTTPVRIGNAEVELGGWQAKVGCLSIQVQGFLRVLVDAPPGVVHAGKIELGLGVVNPRTEKIETVEETKAMIQRALKFFPADKLFLNPDCGFGTFSNRPVNSSEIAFKKMQVIAQAARECR